MKSNALLIDPCDNVVTLLRAVPAGGSVEWAAAGAVVAHQELPVGHKVAIESVAPGGEIRKYGSPIGTAAEPIAPVYFFHTHNLAAAER